MNAGQAIQQIYLPPFPYEAILENVDFALGYFSIGFKRQSSEYQQAIRAGKTNNEHVNHTMASSLRDVESGAPTQRNGLVRRLFAWLPSEFLIVAIQHLTSTFTYTHCEMAFLLRNDSRLKTDSVNVLAVGIKADCGVFINPRKSYDDYEWHHVACDETRMKALLFFAFEEQGKRFSPQLMSKSVVNPGPDERSVYFCSHFTMACLEFLPQPAFHFNRANTLTIDHIHHMVTADDVRAHNVTSIPQAQFNAYFGSAAENTAAIYVERPTPAQEAALKGAKRKKI
jgi:hypothetical protein